MMASLCLRRVLIHVVTWHFGLDVGSCSSSSIVHAKFLRRIGSSAPENKAAEHKDQYANVTGPSGSGGSSTAPPAGVISVEESPAAAASSRGAEEVGGQDANVDDNQREASDNEHEAVQGPDTSNVNPNDDELVQGPDTPTNRQQMEHQAMQFLEGFADPNTPGDIDRVTTLLARRVARALGADEGPARLHGADALAAEDEEREQAESRSRSRSPRSNREAPEDHRVREQDDDVDDHDIDDLASASAYDHNNYNVVHAARHRDDLLSTSSDSEVEDGEADEDGSSYLRRLMETTPKSEEERAKMNATARGESRSPVSKVSLFPCDDSESDGPERFYYGEEEKLPVEERHKREQERRERMDRALREWPAWFGRMREHMKDARRVTGGTKRNMVSAGGRGHPSQRLQDSVASLQGSVRSGRSGDTAGDRESEDDTLNELAEMLHVDDPHLISPPLRKTLTERERALLSFPRFDEWVDAKAAGERNATEEHEAIDTSIAKGLIRDDPFYLRTSSQPTGRGSLHRGSGEYSTRASMEDRPFMPLVVRDPVTNEEYNTDGLWSEGPTPATVRATPAGGGGKNTSISTVVGAGEQSSSSADGRQQAQVDAVDADPLRRRTPPSPFSPPVDEITRRPPRSLLPPANDANDTIEAQAFALHMLPLTLNSNRNGRGCDCPHCRAFRDSVHGVGVGTPTPLCSKGTVRMKPSSPFEETSRDGEAGVDEEAIAKAKAAAFRASCMRRKVTVHITNRITADKVYTSSSTGEDEREKDKNEEGESSKMNKSRHVLDPDQQPEPVQEHEKHEAVVDKNRSTSEIVVHMGDRVKHLVDILDGRTPGPRRWLRKLYDPATGRQLHLQDSIADLVHVAPECTSLSMLSKDQSSSSSPADQELQLHLWEVREARTILRPRYAQQEAGNQGAGAGGVQNENGMAQVDHGGLGFAVRNLNLDEQQHGRILRVLNALRARLFVFDDQEGELVPQNRVVGG
ncbi:unnamed protein product [Amoebophrya sp. A25]|nr:unnamed protein product [Amoebophrya sp. A25]|eukprot:GSA25T00021813001.1